MHYLLETNNKINYRKALNFYGYLDLLDRVHFVSGFNVFIIKYEHMAYFTG